MDSSGRGVLNLTAGFGYGFERLHEETFRTRSREGRDSRISIHMFFPHHQTSVLLNTVAAKWKPFAGNELDHASSAVDRSPSSQYSPQE